MYLISPAEHHKAFTKLGQVSSRPERLGCDFYLPRFEAGVQRKRLDDLINSVQHGDRLYREMAQMSRLKVAVLVVERVPRFTHEGEMLGSWGSWSKAQHYGLLWSVRSKGVWVDWTENEQGTAEWLRLFEKWLGKKRHQALDSRPGPQVPWGKPDSKDYQRHLLMGVDGVGPELAKRIVERFGRVPWKWDVGMEELMNVKGVGRQTAERLMGVFDA